MARKRAAVASPAVVEEERAWIDIDKITPGLNTRMFFPGIVELSQVIEETGNVQDLEVDEELVIVSGERRYRACSLLNTQARHAGRPLPWPKLPCKIIKGDERKKFDRKVAENVKESLRFIEQARIFKTYRDTYGLNNQEISKKTGFAAETVSRYISILEKTSPKIVSLLEDGKQIPTDILIKIHQIPSHEVQELRLAQWQGIAAHTENEAKPSKQRGTALNRRKQISLIALLQAANYSPEAIMVAQFIAGQRSTLPNQLHLKLSRKRQPRPKD